jgi:hypothetical protein
MTSCYGASARTNTNFLMEQLHEMGFFYKLKLLNKLTNAFRKIIKQDLKKSFAIYNLFLKVTKISNKSVLWKNPLGGE